jgi:hypothetical protein
MPSSRVRSRFLTLLVSVPLVVATGPLVAPALAVDGVREAALVNTQGETPRIGPNAGFHGDVSRGVEGRTAIVAISAATGDTIQRVRLTITESGSFAYANDFDSIDGFAVYKDLDDNDRLDPADYAAGPVSQPQPAVTASGGAVVVTIETDALKATGEDNYLVTTHPAATATGERKVNFTIPANGVTTSNGVMPATALAVQDILLDAQAPAAIPLSNYTPVSRIPAADCPSGAANGTCGNDSYRVYRSVAAEPDEQLGFFNNATDLTDAALLTVAPGTKAVYPVESLGGASNDATELSIGNGTGRIATDPTSRALNNQLSDDVWAVLWDPMGNRIIQKLTNAPSCQPGVSPCNEPNPFVPHGNDVTAPNVTHTVATDPVAFGADQSHVRVHAVMTSTDAAVPQFVAQTPVTLLAKPQSLLQIAGSSPPAYTVRQDNQDPPQDINGAEVRSTPVVPSASATADAFVDVHDNTKFPENEYLWSATRLLDTVGNSSVVKNTAAVLKDTVKPSFVRISLIDTSGDGHAQQGEKYRVEFDDPMDTSDITTANVNTKLTIKDPAHPTCGSGADVATPCVNWGVSPTVSWSDDQRVATITLGAECLTLSASCTSLHRLPTTGDLVTAVTVSDRNQNLVSNPTDFPIGQPLVVQVEATTVDTVGAGNVVWNTNRDGVLDAIDVRFSGALDGSTVTQASDLHLFTVTWAGLTLPAVATRPLPDTIHLAFTVPAESAAQWGTGATPRVELKNDPLAPTTTHVESASVPVQPIAAFTLSSVDKVAPVPLSVTTADSDHNGHLDKVFVKFSEGIQQRAENDCGWRVSGYTTSTYMPSHGFPTPTACPQAANQPTAGATNDVVSLALTPIAGFDTGATPTTSFSAVSQMTSYQPNSNIPECSGADPVTGMPGSADCPIVDAAGNGLEAFSGAAADGAAPVITSRVTEDTNSDGRIDRIKVTYSEALSTPSLSDALFAITEPVYSVVSLSVPSATEVAVNVANIQAGQGDTGVTPKLKFLGGATDVANPANAMSADTNPVVVVDKAGPAILAACSSSPAGSNGSCPVDDAANDKVTVLFSETLTGGSVAQADFVVEQPAGTAPKAQTAAPTVETDNKRVTLTFAQGAIAPDVDGVVRLAAAGAVTDAATTGVNASTQTANVAIVPVPKVTLDVTCTVAANANYCGANQVNTGATGSSGITLWRLATTARATTPPDSEFSSSVPSVYPESGILPEGDLTLYLTGKDGFGRLSPEVSDTITILKAPHINNVQVVDSAVRKSGTWALSGSDATVLDGDNVLIGADAQGFDAEHWALNDAHSGGGCLAQYMSIDLRGLTASSNQSTVAPVKCEYIESTGLRYRQMQFPVAKASKTTHYPAGTVLRSATTGYNYLISETSSGTQVRRRFISANARRSWQIGDGLVITVPSALLSGIPAGSYVGYRDGSIVKASTSGYYYVASNVKHLVSKTTLAYWKVPLTTVYPVTAAEMNAMPTGGIVGAGAHPVGMWVQFANGAIQQISKNGLGQTVRRNVANSAALKTLVPTAQVFPANSKDALLPLDTWVRGYRDGTILKLSATSYAVVARSALRRFADAKTFNTLGFSTSNAVGANGGAMPHVTGQHYATGATIDRYKITSIVISVTNLAGTTVTSVVTPGTGGLYAIGTLDPVPAGWDFSHS